MIAVITHSRTKALRYTLPMVLAGRRIERELRTAPGCERYANVIAGPREFWTVTVWRDVHEMRRCMRDGAHGRVMWQQPYWLDCYWGMRLRPGARPYGEWEGDPWQWPDGTPAAPTYRPSGTSAARMPTWMRAALGQTVPVSRRQVAGTATATYRLRVPLRRRLSALLDLHRLRRIASRDPDTFKASLGFGTAGALYLLLVATSPTALDRLRARPEHDRVVRRWGERLWRATWEPEAEFGQWAGAKLRHGRLVAEPPVVDVKLPARPEVAKHARDTLRARLPQLGTDVQDGLQLLTSELVANTIRHGGLGPEDSVGLLIRAKGEWIRVEVRDRGRRFEPQVPLAKSPEDSSGWGLYILDQMSDRWGIIDGRDDRCIWFELRVSDADQLVAAAPP